MSFKQGSGDVILWTDIYETDATCLRSWRLCVEKNVITSGWATYSQSEIVFFKQAIRIPRMNVKQAV